MLRARASFCGSHANEFFKHSSACHKSFFFNVIIPPLISHFEDGHFTLAQTIENLKMGEAFISVSFK